MISLAFNILMFLTMYPSLFIVYFMEKSGISREEKKGILFGIRYSSEWLPDEERAQMMENYHGQLKRALIILALSPLVTFLIPYFSICFTLWMVWPFVMIAILLLAPCARGYNRVRELKAGRAMAMPDEQQDISFYELKDAGNIRAIRPIDLIPIVALNIGISIFVLVYFHGSHTYPYSGIIMAFTISSLLLVACAVWMDRMKTQVISRDSDVNVNFARANKKLWKRFWLMGCWLMTAYTLFLLVYFILPDTSGLAEFYMMIGGCILVSLTMLAMAIYFLSKKEKIDRIYEEKQDSSFVQDERGWIGGIVYYNPMDHHTLVPKKMGTGATFNLATPMGKSS